MQEVKNLTAYPIHNGSQTMVLWKNRQMAANRMRYAGDDQPKGCNRFPTPSTFETGH